MKWVFAAFLMLWPLQLLAQVHPALYDVWDVAIDDVLNIRAGANADTDIIDILAPDQTGVEVIELGSNGKWGRVNTAEQSGWVAMRFLKPSGNSSWSSGETPLYCFGTEPFWSLQIEPANNITLFELMGETPEMPLIKQVLQSAKGYPPEMLIRFDNIGVNSANLTSDVCNDGMSDRDYGIKARVFSISSDPLTPPSMVLGCCSLTP